VRQQLWDAFQYSLQADAVSFQALAKPSDAIVRRRKVSVVCEHTWQLV
jgi:hypothetical protein